MLDWISGGYTRSSLFHGCRGSLASRLSPPPPHVNLGLTRVRGLQLSRPPLCKGSSLNGVYLAFFLVCCASDITHRDRRHDLWLVYGLPRYSLARWRSWIAPA